MSVQPPRIKLLLLLLSRAQLLSILIETRHIIIASCFTSQYPRSIYVVTDAILAYVTSTSVTSAVETHNM